MYRRSYTDSWGLIEWGVIAIFWGVMLLFSGCVNGMREAEAKKCINSGGTWTYISQYSQICVYKEK